MESRAIVKATFAERLQSAIDRLQRAIMMLQTGGPVPTIKSDVRDARHIVEDVERAVWDKDF